MKPEAYAFKFDNDKILKNSSSGGAFSAFSDFVLRREGFIYGAIYDNNSHSVYHEGSNIVDERDRMRGSKYIQSRMNGVYRDVSEKLNGGYYVLFSGTICQIIGLKNYLLLRNITTEKLICCDIICHGVASPKIWKDYIIWKSKQNNIESVFDDIKFRDKSGGWCSSHVIAKYKNRTIELPEFMRLYYSHTITRESCHSCPFTNTNRDSDITIGDFWGIEQTIPDFDSEGGASFILVNSEKGMNFFKEVISENKEIIYKECNITDVNQPNFIKPAPKSIIRERVWKDFNQKGIEYIIKKYTSPNIIKRMGVLLIKIKYKIRKVV